MKIRYIPVRITFIQPGGFRNIFDTRGISSSGRALDLHSRGTGIDTRILHFHLIGEIATYKRQNASWGFPHRASSRCGLLALYRFRTVVQNCRDPGLNQGPSDLQSDALPTELSRLDNCSASRIGHGDDTWQRMKNIWRAIGRAARSVLRC